MACGHLPGVTPLIAFAAMVVGNGAVGGSQVSHDGRAGKRGGSGVGAGAGAGAAQPSQSRSGHGMEL